MPEPITYHNALPLGAMLLEYRLESVLGAGAFGMTYLARDTHLDKQVAIKEYLPTDLAVRALDGSVVPVTTDHGYNYQWGLDRFIQEARTLARFAHPNIVRAYRYFELNGTGYLVMDYEQGASLAQLLRNGPAPDEARLKDLLLPLLDGLEAVHAAGFLHRDIKPANVFVRGSGVPLLLDFGAARQAVGGATQSLTSVLTPGYAPPEQYSTESSQGPWTDIYALAGVAYRMLLKDNPPDAVSRMRNDMIPRQLATLHGRVSESLLASLEWALALDEKRRPQAVSEWRSAILGQAPVPPAPAGTAPIAPSAPQPPTRRDAGKQGRFGWRGVAIVAFLVAVVAGIAARNASRPPDKAVPGSSAARGNPAPKSMDGPRDATKGGLPAAVGEYRDERERPSRERVERPGTEERELELVRSRALQDFRAADTDGDGFLTPDEARRFPVVTKDFGRIDADGDGRISAPEFLRLRELQAGKK